MNVEAIAQVHEDEEALFLALLDRAVEAGYEFISGLYDVNDNVYHVAALCRRPDEWEPYRAPRHFEECDAVALWYCFDSDLTNDNVAGNLIYTQWEDPEEDEEPPEPNVDTWDPLDVYEAMDDFLGLNAEERREVLDRVRQVADGEIQTRWGDPPRSDWRR
jgi:hypothetical protein